MTSRFSSTLVIGVLGALGVVVWSGCGSSSEDNRYYCDGAGCFECDAYGCSPVRSPAHPTCTGNANCAGGGVCTATGCTSTCATDATCPKGETCQGGLCSPPGTAPGVTKECSTKTDCGDGKVCTAAGKCQACGGTAGPCPCTAAKDCSGNQTCVAGACTDTKNTCKYSSECDGKVCADGQCLTSCESTPCGTGYTCTKGVCVPTPGGGGGCTADTECKSPDAPNCVSGSCVKKCDGDAVCGEGKYCNQGACAVDTRPKPKCTKDEDCGAADQKCIGGFCKYTCTVEKDDCALRDGRIPVCAKDLVCRSRTEAAAVCLGPGECQNGQSCIANVCK